jgi:Kef-type K+ transport system membrane component KefB
VSLIGFVGILVRFCLGFGFGQLSAPYLAPDNPKLCYALFVATGFSITAVPILGRIMMEFDLTRTRIGAIAISAARHERCGGLDPAGAHRRRCCANCLFSAC